MGYLAVVVISGLILIGLSLRANRRFRREERLPMQWSLSGSVMWSAPRRVALSFTPALGILILSLSAATMAGSWAGEDGRELPILVSMGAVFVAAHLFHIWAVGMTLRGERH